jgi:hypothetical protein
MDITSIISNPIVIGAITFVGRNIYGWFNNSMKDGKIDHYEWKQLGKTIITLGGFAVFTYLGINAAFPNTLSIEGSAAIVALVDVVRSYIQGLKTAKK